MRLLSGMSRALSRILVSAVSMVVRATFSARSGLRVNSSRLQLQSS